MIGGCSSSRLKSSEPYMAVLRCKKSLFKWEQGNISKYLRGKRTCMSLESYKVFKWRDTFSLDVIGRLVSVSPEVAW